MDGPGVQHAERIADAAGDGELWVSAAAGMLLSGSGLPLEPVAHEDDTAGRPLLRVPHAYAGLTRGGWLVPVQLQLLGRFEAVVDGGVVPPSAWGRRHAAALVKALALADGRRLHREQLLELVWPGVDPATAAPRLHKAAHYARRALGADALHTGNDMVWLDRTVEIDLDHFRVAAERAVREDAENLAAAAIALYGGPLLPDDLFEPWTERTRDEARLLYLDCLRLARQWDAVLREEPADEPAHLALMRAMADKGDLRGALRQFQRMEQALQRELGAVPSAAAQRLRARLEGAVSGLHAPAALKRRPLVGRREVAGVLREHLTRAAQGHGGVVLVSGPPGVGKTAVLDLSLELAEQRGFRTGRGTASAVEGQWPYAPVLEVFSDIGRKHPALLDGLDDAYRRELERALGGRDVEWSGESSHQRLFVAAAELLRLAAAGHGLLFVVDDMQESDDASLRLLHYLARCALREPVLIVAAHRPTSESAFTEIVDSLLVRGAGTRVPLMPLGEPDTLRLLADHFPTCRPRPPGRSGRSAEDAVRDSGAGARLYRQHPHHGRSVDRRGACDVATRRAARGHVHRR